MKNIKFNNILGIDISKKYFDIALLKNNIYNDSNKFNNEQDGFEKLLLWLKSKKLNLKKVLFCMEKTGIYSIKLSNFLVKNNYKVWLEDPIKISKSEGFKRGKNDKIDAIRIAQYAYRFQDNLNLFELNNQIYEEMHHIFTIRDRLIMVLQILEKSLIESEGIFENVFQKFLVSLCALPIFFLKVSIKQADKKLDEMIKENEEIEKKYKIITSVKGIGKQTAIYLLIISRGFTKIKTARKCSCYSGTAPFEYSSGTSIKGRTKISCYGNKKMKKLLYMGVLSIIYQKKGEEYEYYCRKVAEGKHKMKIINALKNKMLGRVFACIRDGRKYEENYKKSA